MSDKQYWLRMKDKVYGPFDANTIRQMVGAGTIRREMNISNDKSTWYIAGDVRGLFPPNVLNDFASSASSSSKSPPASSISNTSHGIEAGSVPSTTPSIATAAAARENDDSKPVIWIVVGVAAVALFYLGGGEIVWNKSWLSLAFAQGVGNILTDGFVISDHLVAVRFNEGIYGLAIVPRFFDSPILSWALLGGSGMCVGEFFRRM